MVGVCLLEGIKIDFYALHLNLQLGQSTGKEQLSQELVNVRTFFKISTK